MTGVCVIDGHPDPADGRFVSALAGAYADGAREAGRSVSRVRIAHLDFPVLRSADEFGSEPPEAIRAVQRQVLEASHLAVFFPLWLGGMPGLTRAFFEQLSRAGFALGQSEKGWPEGRLKGRSGRVVATMGMPATVYRLMFGAHGVRSLERSILGIAGVSPVRDTLIGLVGAKSESQRAKWLVRMKRLGEREA